MVKIEECNKKALTELSIIISKLDEDLKYKIPKTLINNIEKNKDTSYKFNSQELLPETKALLSVIISKYIASDKNKEKWKAYDRNYLEKVEREKRDKYTPDNLFNNKSELNNRIQEEEQCSLVIQKKDKFITALFKKIKKFFINKKNI